jgi:integrase
MRRGEILNLKWGDVDFHNPIMTIQHSKSGKKRMIPMNETLFQTLKRLPSRFNRKAVVFPTNRKGDKGGSRRTSTTRSHGWRKRAKDSEVRFHATRHTFASHLVMKGVDLKTDRDRDAFQILVTDF